MVVRSNKQWLQDFAQYQYDSGWFLERYVINRRRRKEGLPPLRPSL